MSHFMSLKSSIWIAAVGALSIGSIAVTGAEMPTSQPSMHATSQPIKVEGPYGKLTDLTDVQRSQIAEIEKKARAEMREIREKADADSRDVLTDEQKAEFDKMLAEKKATQSEKNKKHHNRSATSEPSDQ